MNVSEVKRVKFQNREYRIIIIKSKNKVVLQVSSSVIPTWEKIKEFYATEEYNIDFQIMEAKELLDEICK